MREILIYDANNDWSWATHTYGIQSSHEDTVGSHDYMKTKCKLSIHGLLICTTKTWTAAHWEGFTGGVFVILIDGYNQPMGITHVQKYGVDGQYVGVSEREESWWAMFPPELAKIAAKLEIIHQKNPKDPKDVITFAAEIYAQIYKAEPNEGSQ
jgi:hypothetical protein